MKVLIIQERIPDYRIPLFKYLGNSEGIELTIAHAYDFVPDLKQIKFKKISKFGFTFIKNDISQIANGFDVVIAMFNIRWLSLMKLAFDSNRKYKLIFWGIGVSSDKGFDNSDKFDWFRYLIARKADALIFYSSYPISKYERNAISISKMFVANNTIETPLNEGFKAPIKNSFLFVGTLYKDKNIEELILAFHASLKQMKNETMLYIIGDGPEYLILEALIKKLNLSDRIKMLGKINNSQILANYYNSSYACISPNQAGLTVLQSMANGVPFITKENAISGGEKLNIVNGLNGYLYKGGISELASLLLKCQLNEDDTRQMGKMAYEHMTENRKISNMADGFLKAIKYSINK